MGDPDAWLAKPQPTPELCRLYHGIDCRRCVDGFDLCDKLVTIEEHHNADAWRRAADERALRLAEFYRRTTRQPEPGKGQDDQQSRGTLSAMFPAPSAMFCVCGHKHADHFMLEMTDCSVDGCDCKRWGLDDMSGRNTAAGEPGKGE